MKQSQKQGLHNQTGALGEQLAGQFLMERGFSILAQNYLKPWGEIDIIAEKSQLIHFIEVKTVSYETKAALQTAISRGTWRPEENVHHTKLARMHRAIESWLASQSADFIAWQIDILAVRVVPREKYATIKYLPNVILD
ncbi:MAG: YraN family protein [Patescibacteria group bacterium]